MFGLLDNLDDPKKLALLMAASGLLSHDPSRRSSFGGDLSRGLLSGLQGYQMGQNLQMRKSEEEQQRKMREMQMAELERGLMQRSQMDSLAQKAFAPNQNLVHSDDEGNPMPSSGGGGMQEFAQGMMGIDPMKGVGLMQQVQQMNKPDLMPVSPGATLYDRRAQKPVFQAPEKTPDWRDPEYVRVQSEIRAAGRPQVNVATNMPPLERKEQGDKGALNVKNFGDIQNAANVARKENSILTAMEKNPVDTSRAAPITSTAAAWLSSAGLGGKRLNEVASNAQAFNAAAMDLVLQKQLAQKGPQTESDAKRLEQTVASLGNTKEANAAIITFSKVANERTIRQEKFYNDWWKKNKTFEGADSAWLESEGGKSLWEDPRLKRYGTSNDGWSATPIS